MPAMPSWSSASLVPIALRVGRRSSNSPSTTMASEGRSTSSPGTSRPPHWRSTRRRRASRTFRNFMRRSTERFGSCPRRSPRRGAGVPALLDVSSWWPTRPRTVMPSRHTPPRSKLHSRGDRSLRVDGSKPKWRLGRHLVSPECGRQPTFGGPPARGGRPAGLMPAHRLRKCPPNGSSIPNVGPPPHGVIPAPLALPLALAQLPLGVLPAALQR